MNREQAIRAGFTHEGYAGGIVPVWVRFEQDGVPCLTGKNQFLDWLLSIVFVIEGLFFEDFSLVHRHLEKTDKEKLQRL